MNKNFFFITLTIALFSNEVDSGAMRALHSTSSRSLVSTLSVGALWEQAGQTHTFFLSPQLEKTYKADKSRSVLASGEFFVGMQRVLNPLTQGQLGIAVAASSTAALAGSIWDDADPEFNNYRYSYKVQNTRVALKGKILFDKGQAFIPWLSASAGLAFNRACRFDNEPVIFEAVKNSNFSDRVHNSFTYTVGAGLQKAVNQHWHAALGYEFADWGKNQLGRASGQSLNSGLSLHHWYTNGLLFSLTYRT